LKLEDFVAETITQIINGINKTHENAKKNGATVNPRIERRNAGETIAVSPIHTVEFDVAVTTIEEKGAKGGFGVFVGPMGIGSQGKSELSNTSMSRIKFSVPVIFPTQDF
jgi:hypothetical protein